MTVLPGLLVAFLASLAALPQGSNLPEIDVTELAKRQDLLGKEILVDGRILYLHVHPGKGYDEIELDLTTVPLVLPPQLAFREAPRQRSVRAQGILKKSGNRTVVEVRALQLQPPDSERLEAALAPLAPNELTRRAGWARWALHRANLYKDEALRKRARVVEAECVRIDASRPEVLKSPDEALAIVRKARAGQVLEPTPSAIAHRAFRASLARLNEPAELGKLAAEVEALFPNSKNPLTQPPRDWDRTLESYTKDPEPFYLAVDPETRTALDRNLLVDVREKSLLAQAAADPRNAFELAAQARNLVPERPALSNQLRDQGLASAVADVSRLRESEIVSLAREFENAERAEEGRQLKRAWLDNQRQRKLGGGDAEGRVNLAEKYLAWLQDRATAVALLSEADAIDPQSAVSTFRRIGYRKDGARWVEVGAGDSASDADRPLGVSDDPLIGLTTEQVEAQQGKPNHRSVVITQGAITLQWIYESGKGGRQVVTFIQKPGSPPTVVSRYGLH